MNQGLAGTYEALCDTARFAAPPTEGGPSEAGPGETLDDGGFPDAADDNDAADIAPDASVPPPAAACDDFEVAAAGVNPSQIWITRLRANLPVAALVTDLTLTTTSAQTEVSDVLRANALTDPDSLCPNDSDGSDCSVSRSAESARRFPIAPLAFGLIFAAWALRRRR